MRSSCPGQHTHLPENNINVLLILIKQLLFVLGKPVGEGSFRGGEREVSTWDLLQALNLRSMYHY